MLAETVAQTDGQTLGIIIKRCERPEKKRLSTKLAQHLRLWDPYFLYLLDVTAFLFHFPLFSDALLSSVGVMDIPE